VRRGAWLRVTAVACAVLILWGNDWLRARGNLAELYIHAFDALITEDQSLNHAMEYIAVETQGLQGLDADGIQRVLDYFRQEYRIDVLDAGFEDLKNQQRYSAESGVFDGILLRVHSARIWAGVMVKMEVSKYRAPLGARGMYFTAWYFGGKWRVRSSGSWVS